MVSNPQPTTPQPSTAVPAADKAGGLLRWGGRVSFWGQLLAIAAASSLLLLAMLSRRLDDSPNSASTGLTIFLAVCGIVVLGVNTFFAYRYSRLARQMQAPQTGSLPPKPEVLRLLDVGLLVALGGVLVTLVGTEIGAISLLARAMTQPQGAAVYEPTKTIRVLDVVVIVTSGGLAIAHLFNGGLTLWLLKRLS